MGEEFGERCVECARDAIEKKDGDVAFAGFELGEVAFGDFGELREIFACERTSLAKSADALGQVAEKKRIGGRGST